jgi:hypothetical protein
MKELRKEILNHPYKGMEWELCHLDTAYQWATEEGLSPLEGEDILNILCNWGYADWEVRNKYKELLSIPEREWRDTLVNAGEVFQKHRKIFLEFLSLEEIQSYKEQLEEELFWWDLTPHQIKRIKSKSSAFLNAEGYSVQEIEWIRAA